MCLALRMHIIGLKLFIDPHKGNTKLAIKLFKKVIVGRIRTLSAAKYY